MTQAFAFEVLVASPTLAGTAPAAAPALPPILAARGLAAVRGRTTLFEDLSFDLAPGRVLVLRGRNGSGKTTLLRMLAGLVTPAHGHVHWHGAPLAASLAQYHGSLLYLGHLPGVSEMMSVRENLAAWVSLDSGSTDAPGLDEALERVGLRTRRNLPARMLSAGQRRRIGLARLLLARRELWLLDEPTTALDAAGIELLGAAIARHVARGGSAVIATHQAMPIDAAQLDEIVLA